MIIKDKFNNTMTEIADFHFKIEEPNYQTTIINILYMEATVSEILGKSQGIIKDVFNTLTFNYLSKNVAH